MIVFAFAPGGIRTRDVRSSRGRWNLGGDESVVVAPPRSPTTPPRRRAARAGFRGPGFESPVPQASSASCAPSSPSSPSSPFSPSSPSSPSSPRPRTSPGKTYPSPSRPPRPTGSSPRRPSPRRQTSRRSTSPSSPYPWGIRLRRGPRGCGCGCGDALPRPAGRFPVAGTGAAAAPAAVTAGGSAPVATVSRLATVRRGARGPCRGCGCDCGPVPVPGPCPCPCRGCGPGACLGFRPCRGPSPALAVPLPPFSFGVLAFLGQSSPGHLDGGEGDGVGRERLVRRLLPRGFLLLRGITGRFRVTRVGGVSR